VNYEKIAAKFQQRLAETVARYEADLAIQADQYETEIERLKAELESKDDGDNVVPEIDLSDLTT